MSVFLRECGCEAAYECEVHTRVRKDREAHVLGFLRVELNGRDQGGRRDFLDGKPIHCGTVLELAAIVTDAEGRTSFTGKAIAVRYEAQLYSDAGLRTLHADVGGHEVVMRLEPWLYFRWPVKS